MNRPAFAPLRRGKSGQAGSIPQLLRSAVAQIARRSDFAFTPRHSGVSPAILLLCLSLITGCMRHDPPADVTIINYSEPQSLDPAIITAQPDMRTVAGMFEGRARPGPRAGRAIRG